MPNPSLENPFANVPAGNPDTAAYIAKVLGEEEATKYRKLDTRRTSHVPRPSDEEVGMTDEERAKATERGKENAEAREKRETRKRLIEWAEEFDIAPPRWDAKKWVDLEFDFSPSGEAMCLYELDLHDKGITHFPKGIIHVSLDLVLDGNQLVSLENMPHSIVGSLRLSQNPLFSLEGLPQSIAEDLWLEDIPATTLPKGLKIGGVIRVARHQAELADDARRKGYHVSY